ncbi:MAG: hypothetical protein WCF84_23990 [Anaerolineae bacterium]
MNRITKIIVGVVLAIILAGSSFYGGILYARGPGRTTQASGRFAGAPNGNNGQNGTGAPGQGGLGQGRGGGLFGQVVQAGDGVLVISDNNGAQTKILVTDTTLIEKNASVKLTDIAQGETVIVSGAQAADGTYTARSIQVAPAGRFAPDTGQNPGAQNPSGNNNGNQNPGNGLPRPSNP